MRARAAASIRCETGHRGLRPGVRPDLLWVARGGAGAGRRVFRPHCLHRPTAPPKRRDTAFRPSPRVVECHHLTPLPFWGLPSGFCRPLTARPKHRSTETTPDRHCRIFRGDPIAYRRRLRQRGPIGRPRNPPGTGAVWRNSGLRPGGASRRQGGRSMTGGAVLRWSHPVTASVLPTGGCTERRRFSGSVVRWRRPATASVVSAGARTGRRWARDLFAGAGRVPPLLRGEGRGEGSFRCSNCRPGPH